MSSISDRQMGAPPPRRKGNLTLFLVVFATLLALALPTMIVLFFGMLPSMVAAIVDRSKGKSATFTVTGINFIGVFPYIMELWTGENSMDNALNMLDIFTLMVMYSAAAMGWLLFMSAPQIISSFVLVMQQRKIASLRAGQKELIEEWGPEVAALTEGAGGDEWGVPHAPIRDEEEDEEEDGSAPPP